MEYGAEDFSAIKSEINKKLLLFGFLTAAYLGIAIALFMARMQLACTTFTFFAGAVLIFFIYVYLVPPVIYRRFLKEMHKGQQRENFGEYVRIEEDLAVREGLSFKAMITVDEEGFEHRYYWDVQKPLPHIEAGTSVKIITYGQSIKKLEVV